MPVGNKIVYDFKRPARETVEQFRGIPVANIDDNMGRIAAVHSSIVPMNKVPLLGPAFTVKVPQGDNLMFHKAMDLAQKGDVIVIDAGGFDDRAIFGELMITYLASRGIAGVVVDGAIRDVEEISEMTDISVYAKAVTPNGPYKNGPGEIGTPVTIGGKIVRPGDIVYGDGDGIIIIDPALADELAAQGRATVEKEDKIRRDILEKGIYPRPWVDEKLKEIGCEF